MLGTVILYTVLLSTVLPINGLQDKQLDAVVKLLESQVTNGRSSSEEETSGEDEAHSLVEHRLKTKDVINLIQQASKYKKTANNYNNRLKLSLKPNALNQFYQSPQYDSNRYDKDIHAIKNRVLEQLLNNERKPLKNNYDQRLTPNRLLSPYEYKYEDEDRGPQFDLNEYSKIYVILDPNALQESRNTENLPNLLSRILAQTSAAVEQSRQDKINRYKGFVVRDSSKSRRFRRESKEMHGGGGGGGDMDDDYRPKRPRNDHNAGGGGGRTAIPYIRHRGDIYERDH